MAVTKSLSVEDANLAVRSLISAREQKYSDIDLSFAKKTNGDIFKKTEAAAVKQAVKTLIQTNFGERPFNYYFGSNIRALLFEPVTPDIIDEIKLNVRLAIENFEPRAELLDVRVLDEIDRNSINVSIRFKVVSTDEQVEIQTAFSRLR
ncbi:GPW/gp25 family protein [bacterium]|nr:GPW/gp25 family protein [bacterium]|tara:strand:- start:21669 stop:22115 length:447 start_codon:yes stop_codon:yes gene_type:complete